MAKKKPGDKGYIPLRYRGEDTNPGTGEALAAAFSAGRKKKSTEAEIESKQSLRDRGITRVFKRSMPSDGDMYKRKPKKKAKPKAKDSKRSLKAGEMRGTTAQRKSAFNKIAKKRTERKRRASPRYTRTRY